MPTPSDETPSLLSPPIDALDLRTQHTTCPPEEGRTPERSAEDTDGQSQSESAVDNVRVTLAQQPTPPSDLTDPVSAEINDTTESLAKRMEIDEDGPVRDTPSPMSSTTESKDVEPQAGTNPQASTSSSTSIPYASLESPWVGQHRVCRPLLAATFDLFS